MLSTSDAPFTYSRPLLAVMLGGGGCCCRRLLIALAGGALLTLTALFLVSIIAVICSADATTGSDESSATADETTLEKALAAAQTNSSLLYECELSYLQMDMSLIKFSINYLELIRQQMDDGGHANQAEALFRLSEIGEATAASQLASTSKLNASLPFVFFINGFNTFGPGAF